MKIKILLCALLFTVSPSAMAASVYIAELDPTQSSFFINFDDTTIFQLSGTIQISVDQGTIQFEALNLSSSPAQDTTDIILSDVGNYDGLNFEYVLCDTCIGNTYNGTFDGSSLFLEGISFTSFDHNYTMVSSSITAVPLPNSFFLLSTALVGLGMRYRKKTQTRYSR